jgi:quinol monooxygenase YgiN
MKYVIGWIRIKPGQREQFLAECRGFFEATRAEPGVVAFEFLPSLDDPDVVVCVESYTSPEAHDAHRATPHFEAFRPLIKTHVMGGRFEAVVTDTVTKDAFGTF